MPYDIVIHEQAAEEIEQIRAYDQTKIIEAMEEHLTRQPTVRSRRRKCLVGLAPAFEHVLPVWELRVGDYRVFYDVEEEANSVHVRAVRRKRPAQRTEDIT